MAEYGEGAELSKADLAALDLIIAEMQERGLASLGDPESLITVITPAVRTIATQVVANVTADALTRATRAVVDATAEVTQRTPEITPAVRAVAEMPAAGGEVEVLDDEILRSLVSDEITLERLIEVREELRKL